MANMSYIRFENTLSDLQDCYESLGNEDFNELSESEKENAKHLISLCKHIWDDFKYEIDDEDK